MNLKQHLEEIDKRFDKAVQKNYRGQDPYWPDWEGVKSFVHTEAIELVKKAFEETQLQEADRTVIDGDILEQVREQPFVAGITRGWNDAYSTILQKQKEYLENL